MLVVVIISSGLSPYKLLTTIQDLKFIPFYGFLGGSMFVNTASLLEKIFLYGSLIWLFQQAGIRLLLAIMITASLTFMVELAQLVFVGHVAEITDPVLVILIGFSLGGIVNASAKRGGNK